MTASVWFPDAFEGVPVGGIERLTGNCRWAGRSTQNKNRRRLDKDGREMAA